MVFKELVEVLPKDVPVTVSYRQNGGNRTETTRAACKWMERFKKCVGYGPVFAAASVVCAMPIDKTMHVSLYIDGFSEK